MTTNAPELMRKLLEDRGQSRDLMITLRSNRKSMGPLFVDMVTRISQDPLENVDSDEITVLVKVLLLLAEWRDPYTYRPFARLMRRPRQIIEPLLGDRGAEFSHRILASIFDGDLSPMEAAVYDPLADEFSRGRCMQAMVLTALAHPQSRADVEEFIRHFTNRCPETPDELMITWVQAIADLGLDDMRDQAENALRTHPALTSYMEFSEFEDSLNETLDGNGVPSSGRYRKFLITDALGEMR